MATKNEVIFSDAKIKWVGAFDLLVFYRKLQEWLKLKKYESIAEKRYVEKVKPNGKQIEIVWECEKKEDFYFKYRITLKFFLLGVVEAEAEKDGKRLKLTKVDIEITIDSEVLKDYEEKWKDKPHMRAMYERYVIPYKIEEAKIECYKDTTDLMEEIKNYFALYSLK